MLRLGRPDLDHGRVIRHTDWLKSKGMGRPMKRFALLLAGLATVVACDSQEYSGPVDLNGRWGWGSVANCDDDTSVWVFNQELWEIRRRSEVVERREFNFTRDASSGLLILEYINNGAQTTRRLRIEDGGNQVRLMGGTVNDASDPSIEFQINNIWVRCPEK